MRISLFIKTFLMLLISFTLVFLFSMYFSQKRFGPMYIEENIEAVKRSIISEADAIQNGTKLEDTNLLSLSSETSFLLYQFTGITDQVGPNFLTNEEDIIHFITEVYDNRERITDGSLTYLVVQKDDIYEISYIYEYEFGNWMIVQTKIQSLQNVELVLQNINQTQSISIFITILLLSIIISSSISKPLKKVNQYAKDISILHFDSKLNIKRKDEFKDLVSSLNEMAFNLKKSYKELHEANLQLNDDIEFEKKQEEKKKQLIYTINHELKTPLSVMKGMIEGMIDGVGRYKDKETYLQALLDQIAKIEIITRDLTYSLRLDDKAKAGDYVNTNHVLEHLDDLEELAAQNGIKIIKHIKEETVLINEELLVLLLQNLVKNAILYSKGNSISIDTETHHDTYTFIIRNKGHIKEEDLHKVFDSFYRSDVTNKNGSGLGLHIVKQICELYSYEYKLFNDNEDVVAKINIKIKK